MKHIVNKVKMKLYVYRGLDNEKVPDDVTHVIVDGSVTVIKKEAFRKGVFGGCRLLVSVIMGDNVKRIEECAFLDCIALRFIRLSRTLEHIEGYSFCRCHSLEALFLPSTLKSIREDAFVHCHSLILLVLPDTIYLGNVGDAIIC